MKTYIISKGLYFFIAAFTFIVISGCDSNNSDDDAPEVIPSEVFTLPVDLFNLTTSKSSNAGANFTAAALRVWPVSLIITANMIIPSITTLQALETEPVFQDGAWLWTSSATSGSQGVQFTLSAERTNSGTQWSMKISTTDPLSGVELNDFELFSAETSDNGTVGSWQLFYYLDGTSQNVLDASYVNTSETDKSITFSIPATASQSAGDTIEYRESEEERSFVWQQAVESITHSVNWNATTTEGSITATNFNGGTEGCWDASLEDIACTPS